MSDQQLIKNLQNDSIYNHPVSYFKLLETHNSWIILTGTYAYKIKKPVDLEFMNYSTLEKRHYYCNEEIKLNQLFPSDLYIGLVNITGNVDAPEINGKGPIIEYAVKMREFPQDSLFNEMLAQQKLTSAHIEELAKLVAEFHLKTPVAPENSVYGTPEHVHFPVIQNFDQIFPFLTDNADIQQLNRLRDISEQQFQQHQSLLQTRKKQGFIRDCHGDLHLGNIILYKNKPLLFDRIEFNEDLRWIDVFADIAFLTMDLEDHQQTAYARICLNTYLRETGDYAGLALLPYYQAYRAIVRAKIALFSLHLDSSESFQKNLWQKYRRYMKLAEHSFQAQQPALFITHGLTGSGKSSVAHLIVEQCGALQVSSDIERKRMFGFSATADTQSEPYKGIYDPEVTTKIYTQLAETTQTILNAGYSVVADATFLKHSQRAPFNALAEKHHIPFVILQCEVPRAQLEERIQYRKTHQNDPSEGRLDILSRQEAETDPFDKHEQNFVFKIDALDLDKDKVISDVQTFIGR